MEWDAALEALWTVDGRVYFGFRWDLGAVWARLFRHMAWVCKELLIRAGNGTISNYRWAAEDLTRKVMVIQ